MDKTRDIVESNNHQVSATNQNSGPRILKPITQVGPVDVSSLYALDRGALRSELVSRARKLFPILDRNAVETEKNRRVVEENVEAIRQAGLFKIMIPRRFGGLETDMRTMLEVSRELGRACGSTAWITTLMNVCNWFGGVSSLESQTDIWGTNPDARLAGVLAAFGTTRAVKGGLRVTGKWPWASGCLHADWATVGIPITDADGNMIDQGSALIPMSELTIEDTWFTVGMKGTGSNTLVADDVFVPDHRLTSVSRLLACETATPFKNESLYRSASTSVFALVLVGPQLGLCARALEHVIEFSTKRKIAYTFYETQAISPSFQMAVAKAASLIDEAHLLAYRAADAIDDMARQGKTPTHLDRARARMDTGRVVTLAREAIDILLSAHGASSFADFNPLQRIWRDCETASRHAVVSPEISAEIYGRALVGIEEGVSPLI